MNPSNVFLKRGGAQYRLHDKVMQIRNDYDKEVFNGDIRIVVRVDTEDGELTVNFDDREVTYDVTELDELVLAYATTIHKAQGSEYPIVVMPFTMSHYVMLQRNLLYTGVTRAKKILVLIGEKKAIACAVQNESTAARNTKLAARLRDMQDATGGYFVKGRETDSVMVNQNVQNSYISEGNQDSDESTRNQDSNFSASNLNGRGTGGIGRAQKDKDAGETKSSVSADPKVIKIDSRNKGVYPEIYQPEMSKVAEQQTPYGMNTLFNRLAQSKFRSSFALNANDRAYVQDKGMEAITSHARDFVKKRLAPAEPAHDGKQMPMRGHPVFIAQHATATCCRGCLEKWHHIPKGQAPTDEQQEYIVQVLTEWINRQMRGYGREDM